MATFEELVARMQAVWRRMPPDAQPHRLEFTRTRLPLDMNDWRDAPPTDLGALRQSIEDTDRMIDRLEQAEREGQETPDGGTGDRGRAGQGGMDGGVADAAPPGDAARGNAERPMDGGVPGDARSQRDARAPSDAGSPRDATSGDASTDAGPYQICGFHDEAEGVSRMPRPGEDLDREGVWDERGYSPIDPVCTTGDRGNLEPLPSESDTGRMDAGTGTLDAGRPSDAGRRDAPAAGGSGQRDAAPPRDSGPAPDSRGLENRIRELEQRLDRLHLSERGARGEREQKAIAQRDRAQDRTELTEQTREPAKVAVTKEPPRSTTREAPPKIRDTQKGGV